MITVIPIPAFKDNYIWLLINNATKACAVVDPGDAAPVLDYLQKNHLRLHEILITHHHHDHTGGIEELQRQLPDVVVYGPANESIPHLHHALSQKSPVLIPSINVQFQILDIPGHTKGHIAYYGQGMLFCGDTLFAAGCGRVFEGTFAQMFKSLEKISRLPASTAIYCAHEYTQANLHFAETVEPRNQDIQKRIKQVATEREQGKPTLPSTLALEKKTNPFLRCNEQAVILAAQQKSQNESSDALTVFQTIRTWKDSF